MTTSTSSPTSGAMIDVEGVSRSFGETEAFVSVKLEGPGGHRAGVARPERSWQRHACWSRNLGVYVDPQHAGLAAGLRQSQPIARAANTVRALTEGGPVDTKPFRDRPVEHRHPGRLRPLAVRRYRKG